jgi:excisionase family DNA binding protein
MSELVTLGVAAERKGVTRRQLRAQITRGRLPAVKVGRSYLVAPSDLDALYAPRLQPMRDARHESPTAREDAQLRAAGFVPSSH